MTHTSRVVRAFSVYSRRTCNSKQTKPSTSKQVVQGLMWAQDFGQVEVVQCPLTQMSIVVELHMPKEQQNALKYANIATDCQDRICLQHEGESRLRCAHVKLDQTVHSLHVHHIQSSRDVHCCASSDMSQHVQHHDGTHTVRYCTECSGSMWQRQ